jgi:2,3-bisphosphoglycerate-independent phosphoglycerate mutase
MSKNNKPVVLVILDGWGEWDVEVGNAIAKANLPTIVKLDRFYPKTLLQASGLAVGLPWGERGNSEVGHQAMGAGQIIYQHLPAISMSIQNGEFAKNEALLEAMDWAKKNKSSLHFWGLLSDGGVHSHIDHLSALLGLAKSYGVKNFFVHAVTDGRDTPPKNAKKYLEAITKLFKEFEIGSFATICGRYYAMDRNKNWDRTEKAFQAMVAGEGILADNAIKAIEKQYKAKLIDEYLEPIVLTGEDGKPLGQIKENDSIICFNFREDRTRQMAAAFAAKGFSEFKKAIRPKNVNFTGFVKYGEDVPAKAIFSEQKITTRLGEILSKKNIRQLRIAETEKYAHVTYFFNGGIEEPYKGEDRILIPSKNVPSYAKTPEMSAREITDRVIKEIEEKKYDFILINYANPDMVGHTGDLKAGVRAVETVDACLGDLIDAVTKQDGCLLVTADHGNVEEMINTVTHEKDTEHSTNPVPCWLIKPHNIVEKSLEPNCNTEISGMIIDIAPTVLELLDIKPPKEMIGRSLLAALSESK